MPRGPNPTTVLHVAREIRRWTVLGEADLPEPIGCSLDTIRRSLRELEAGEFIERLVGQHDKVRLNGDQGLLIGVDTTTASIQVAITNLAYEGKVYLSEEPGWPNRRLGSSCPEQTMGVIAKVVHDAINKYRDEYGPSENIVGVGVAVTGPVQRGGRSRSPELFPTHRTRWSGGTIDIPELLTEALSRSTTKGYPPITFPRAEHRRVVAADNDASLGALGVFTRARIAEFLGVDRVPAPDDVLYVRVTTMGVGSGIILKGHLVTGADGFAGEIGHLRVRRGPDGALCPRCGGRGCLETLSSERAVLAQLEEVVHHKDGSRMDISELLESPHPAVQEALWEAGWWTGVAIAHACVMLNPTQVILGGALVDDPRFRSRAWHAIEQNAMAEVRAGGEKGFMPTWKQLAVDNASLNLPENLTPELLGALALVVDELGDDYLLDPITAWYRYERKKTPQ